MSRLLIPAILFTVIIGILWFFIYPEKEDAVIDFINEKKEEILSDGQEFSSVYENYEFKEFLFPGSDGVKNWRLISVKVDPGKFNFDLIINSDQTFAISDIAVQNECAIAMNGTFFDPKFQTLGLLIDDGLIINKAHKGELASGVFYISVEHQAGIVPFADYKIENDDFAIQSGPLILKADGSSEITSQSTDADSRTMIGVDDEGFVHLMIIYPKAEKDLMEASLYEVTEVFRDAEKKLGVNFQAVLNLDGGSSTGLYTKDFYFAEQNIPQNIICLKVK